MQAPHLARTDFSLQRGPGRARWLCALWVCYSYATRAMPMLLSVLIAFFLTLFSAAEAQTQLQALIKRYEATSFITIEEIRANPYVYEGRNYLLRLRFVRMAGATSAVFEETGPADQKSTIHLIKVPPKAFSSGHPLIAAVRVIGYDEASPFPEVELVGFELCKS